VLEFFISTHGARKGLADTALRTADSGYLTRRLVDVAQEVIVREDDCGSERGLTVTIEYEDGVPTDRSRPDSRLFGRIALDEIVGDGEVIVPAGEMITRERLEALLAAEVGQVRVRSTLMCNSKVGVCVACYGMALGSGKLVEIGEAVGTIAAQSIGEPGTQLTMRTFHTGGIASAADITQGLPRVTELFEARTPKGKAEISRIAGRVSSAVNEEKKTLTITVTNGEEEFSADVSPRVERLVADGEEVVAGDALTAGPFDPKELLEVKSSRAVQEYLADQVQDVYTNNGVDVHDKHIELIVRQMMRKVTVQEPGDSEFLPGERVDQRVFLETNRELVQDGKKPAEARQELMGITKASLATESWLSAASFQETTRVLTEAAIEAKSDPLIGLKENVIIGRLIPAGTGVTEYRDLVPELPEGALEAVAHPYFADLSPEEADEYLRSIGTSRDDATTLAEDLTEMQAEADEAG
jgi:DNA-directed RNA polymerase subunit beta'